MPTYFLINPVGRVTELDITEAELPGFLKQKFRLATDAEIAAHQLKVRPTTYMQANKLLDVYFLAPQAAPNGYGASGENLEKALLKLGINLNRKYQNQSVGLVYHHPFHLKNLETPVKILYTMFESTGVPEDWPELCKIADLIITPSRFCQKALASRGIKSHVLPLGYDEETFKFHDRKNETKPFTFMHYDAFNVRKGWDLLFEAFNQEFAEHEPVRLCLKTVRKTPILFQVAKKQYKNVLINDTAMTSAELNTYLQGGDCFVFPSRGEGFGLPPLEALATGMPGIVPNGSGMAEYFDNRYFYDVKFAEGIKPVYEKYKENEVGTMIKADIQDLRRAMRYAATHQNENYARGKAGAEWAKENYGISKTAKLLADILIKADKKYTGKAVRVIEKQDKPTAAVIMDNVTYYSGGRYLNWLQAYMLAYIGYDVTVYTNHVPKFVTDFDPLLYPAIKIEHVAYLTRLDVQADLYFGSPQPGVIMATRLAKKYKAVAINQLFDPPTWMQDSAVCTENELNWVAEFKKELSDAGDTDIKILTLTENAREDFARYLNWPLEKTFAIHPPINSRLLRMFDLNKERKNWIVAISRNDKRKAWPETLKAFAPYCREYELHVITHTKTGIYEQAAALGIPLDSIKVHEQISDTQKFMLLAQAKAVLSSSHFEGFGMYSIEGRAAGIPVVAYDLPPFKEIKGGIDVVEVGAVDKLSETLGNALKTIQATPKTIHFDHDFEVIAEQLKAICNPPEVNTPEIKGAKITALYIVLNEEKFIKASLLSVLKRPEVQKVIIVEGADRLYSLTNNRGLSVDKTANKIRSVIADFKDKVIYERYGWADGKSELRQRTIDIMQEQKLQGWALFVDGDEVWEDGQWVELVRELKNNPGMGAVYFKHLHFWKNLKQIAVGSMWDTKLFRCFQVNGEPLKLTTHASEVLIGNEKIGDKFGRIQLENVALHHYGALKSEQEIKAKLEYYGKRDEKLEVKDTWTNWKPGDETQWTHKGGTVQAYEGVHPAEVLKIKNL